VKNRKVKKPKAPKKSASTKYKKRQKQERGNRAIKDRTKAEFEFAQRIQKEPGLATLLDRERGAKSE